MRDSELRAAFDRFVGALPGVAVLCADDPAAAALATHASQPRTYGTDAGATYRVVAPHTEGTGVRFTLEHAGARHQANKSKG